FSFDGGQPQAQNLVGISGAYFSDLALFLFGWVAYLVPVALAIAAIRWLLDRLPRNDWMVFSLRSLGWLLLTAALCILLQVHVAGTSLPAGPGGVLGEWLATLGVNALGWVGLTLIALTAVMVGLQAACGFSWLSVLERTGSWVFWVGRLTRRSGMHLRQRYNAWQTARDARRDLALANAPAPAKPVIAPLEETVLPVPAVGTEVKPTPRLSILPKAKEKPRQAQKRLFNINTNGELPDLELLDEPKRDADTGYSPASLEAISRQLELKLADFNVEAVVVSVLPGPVVTRFEIQPAAGVKVQKISALAKDLARSLAVISVRIVEVIPGKSVVGIEIPNEQREMVYLKEVITSSAFQDSSSPLTLALGKDIAGASIVTDIAKMPHMLVAGTTGSGKSVGVNAMLLSILCKSTPDEVRLILVDPKMLELSVYEGIPHLLAPVVTDMKEAAHALNWCVGEMERRYKLMAALGVRNLAGFNKQVKDAIARGEPLSDPLWLDESQPAPDLTPLPSIVVVIDEFADMMMIVGKKVEQLIARIAQKARAAGIHLILATQRPSVDVITGLIKANIPARIGFQVSSKVDSRTILDQGGAEQLLGHGDMLFLPPGTALPQRIHGAFVSDDEVHRLVEDWKLRGEPDYLEEIVSGEVEGEPFVQLDGGGDSEQDDELYDEAVQFVLDSRRASISAVQRKLRIGYNRAARLIEAMEVAGVVSEMGSNGNREVLVPKRD
ncbi:MAG: DNA translocase FtsK 4TM domain-containing protein, partial [Pseudomonadota bacterium]